MTQRQELLDPELATPLEGFLGAVGGGFDLGDVAAARRIVDGVTAAVKAQAPKLEGLEVRDLDVPGFEGAPPVRVRVYRPTGHAEALPGLVWMHPGGWVLGSIDLDGLAVAQLAKEAECVAVSVEYRLAPEHPFPAALHDCYAALAWLGAEGGALGVDPTRIAVGGSSAGGNLAAALALMARDRGGVRPAFQLLIYPALDDRTAMPGEMGPETLFWSRRNVIDGWAAYLGTRPGSDGVSEYAAPSRARDLAGLPPAYIAVGALDPFVDENIAYAGRLLAAGVAAELHVYPGACHAFDVFGADTRIGRRFIAERNAVLRGALYPAVRSPAAAA
ncbi:MAG TPA: alpha/beta hydrolase [Gammaproteobacteria bacterium]